MELHCARGPDDLVMDVHDPVPVQTDSGALRVITRGVVTSCLEEVDGICRYPWIEPTTEGSIVHLRVPMQWQCGPDALPEYYNRAIWARCSSRDPWVFLQGGIRCQPEEGLPGDHHALLVIMFTLVLLMVIGLLFMRWCNTKVFQRVLRRNPTMSEQVSAKVREEVQGLPMMTPRELSAARDRGIAPDGSQGLIGTHYEVQDDGTTTLAE